MLPAKNLGKKATLKNTVRIPDLNNPDLLKEKKDNEADEKNLPKDDYTLEDLKNHWDEYADNAAKKSQMSLVTIMKNRDLTLENNTIILPLNNTLLVAQLNDYKEDLMQHIRLKLNNFSITLEARIIKEEETQMLYTSQQKFDHLIKEHPMLEELKKRLGLELDF